MRPEKRRFTKADRIILIVLAAALLLAVLLQNLGARKKTGQQDPAHTVTWQDYQGRKIGVLSGTNMEEAAKKFFPQSEYFYYKGYPDMNAALEAGIIDAYLVDEPAIRCTHASQPQIDYIKEYLPAMMNDDEIRNIILGMEDKSVGTVMKTFKAKYAGQADMKKVQEILKSL